LAVSTPMSAKCADVDYEKLFDIDTTKGTCIEVCITPRAATFARKHQPSLQRTGMDEAVCKELGYSTYDHTENKPVWDFAFIDVYKKNIDIMMV